MGGIAWTLIGLEHPIRPSVPGRQRKVGIEDAALAAVGVVDRRIVDVHELRTGGNCTSEYVRRAYRRHGNTWTGSDSAVGILKVETADGAIQVWSAVAVIQVERSSQPDRQQGLSFARRVDVSGSDVVLILAGAAAGAYLAQALKEIIRRAVFLNDNHHMLDWVVGVILGVASDGTQT